MTSKPNCDNIAAVTRTPLQTALYFGIVIALGACRAGDTATPTPEPASARPTPRATATLGTPPPPTNTPNPNALLDYNDPSAPFTMQYPASWKVREEPESIFFQSPDQAATIQVIVYEYPEGAPRTTTAKEIFDRFTQSFTAGTGLKLSNTATRSDGSIYADTAFQDASTPSALQGFVRVLLAKSRRFHFILLFSADASQFARYKSIATTASESFRER